jgi:hypothetical protein
MHRTTWLTPSERRWRRSPPRTRCGSNGVFSPMASTDDDLPAPADRDILAFQMQDGFWILAKKDGDKGEWIRAAETVAIKRAR